MGRARTPAPVIRGELLSPQEAARRADCTDRSVVAAIKRGDLPAYRVIRERATHHAWAIDPADLDAWSGPRPRGGKRPATPRGT